MNLSFSEAMSFDIQKMSSKTSLIWQSRSLVPDSGSKGKKSGQKNSSEEESILGDFFDLLPIPNVCFHTYTDLKL